MSFSIDWMLFSLRLIFIVVLYFFLFQLVRLTTRELSLLTATKESALPKRRPGPRLVLVDPAETLLQPGISFALDPVTLVGRHPGCTIVLDDSFVSAEHAELEANGGEWLLRDLDSTNGTFVNDERVYGSRVIEHDDIVQFGHVTMRLVW